MKPRTRILLTTVATSLSLAAAGFSQDQDNKDKAGKPKAPDAKPAAEEKAKRPEPPRRPASAPPAQRDTPAGRDQDRPDVAKIREQMQSRMKEIQELRAAGKNDEAEKKMAEAKKQMESMRSRFGHNSDRRPGSDGLLPNAQRGPQRPPMDTARADAKKREAQKPTDRPDAKPARPAGSPSETEIAKIREHMKGRMEEIQKLRAAGKHDEANQKMAEGKKQFEEMRAKFGHRGAPGRGPGPGADHGRGGPGAGGPPWATDAQRGPHRGPPPMAAKKPEAPKKPADKAAAKPQKPAAPAPPAIAAKQAEIARKKAETAGRHSDAKHRGHESNGKAQRHHGGPSHHAQAPAFARHMQMRRAEAMKRMAAFRRGTGPQMGRHFGPRQFQRGPQTFRGPQHSGSPFARKGALQQSKRGGDHGRGGPRFAQPTPPHQQKRGPALQHRGGPDGKPAFHSERDGHPKGKSRDKGAGQKKTDSKKTVCENCQKELKDS